MNRNVNQFIFIHFKNACLTALFFEVCAFLAANCYGFDCMLLSCHVAFQSESTLHNCLNAKELLAGNKRTI